MKENGLEKWALTRLSNKQASSGPYSDILSRLTIVIPSYGRQAFLVRQAVYWGYSSVKVIVVDGSPEPLSSVFQELIYKLPNVSYYHDMSGISDRLKLAMRFVETPYVVMHGDDEFFLKPGLAKAVQELDSNKSDVAACMGQSLEFFISAASHEVFYSELYNHFHYNVIRDNAIDRMIFAMQNYTPVTCYAVLRTQFMKSWLEILEDFSCSGAIEIQQSLLTYIYGKLVTVDEVYWLRSSENPAVFVPESNQTISFYLWYVSPKYSLQRKRFIDGLSTKLAEVERIDLSEATNMIIEAVEVFLEFGKTNSQFIEFANDEISTAGRIRNKLKGKLERILSERMFDSLMKVYRLVNPLPVTKFRDPNLAISHGLSSESIANLREIEILVKEFYGCMNAVI